jgi:hypothetical protein
LLLFLRSPVKVEIMENGTLTFPNGFFDLSQLLPTFPRMGKVNQTTTFPTFPPYYIGGKLKSRSHKWKKLFKILREKIPGGLFLSEGQNIWGGTCRSRSRGGTLTRGALARRGRLRHWGIPWGLVGLSRDESAGERESRWTN